MKDRTSRLFTFYVLLLILFLAALSVVPAFAQESTPTDDEVNAIAKQLYCPVCENTPLDVCPTEACRQWRGLIREQLADGWTEDQIKQYFVDNYGARVLAEPPRAGLNWLFYILPPAVILAGAWLLVRSLRAWNQRTSALTPTSPPADDDEYAAKLEEELKKRN